LGLATIFVNTSPRIRVSDAKCEEQPNVDDRLNNTTGKCIAVPPENGEGRVQQFDTFSEKVH